MLESLKKSKKPILFVGNGVRLAHAEELLFKLIQRIQIPILTTWRAADLFEENHRLYVGRPGAIGQRGANTILQMCDFLLCLGTRLDLSSVAFNYPNFAPLANKFIVDIDQEELNKLDFPKTGICQDIKTFITDILENKPIEYLSFLTWLKECKKLHGQPIETIRQNSDKLSLYQFIDKIGVFLENQIVVLGSSGTVSEVFCQALKIPQRCRIIQSNGLGSMGFGLSAAIGAHYASGRPVVCFDGDGSFAMNIQELSLVKGENLPIRMFIINNGGYVSIRNTQNNICDGRLAGVDKEHGLFLPNYSAIARAFGINYYTIRNQADVSNLNYYPHQAIVEVFTDPNHKTQCRTITKKDENGNLRASNLEDLWP